jgi:heme/copper-type cytochrome/quinol oxidase subunit 1
MSNLSLRCIKAAFFFLACGIGLGASFALNRSLGAALRPLHAELNLWGWTTLLIYGFGYHMLPRFSGRPLRSPALAAAQSWLAIAGVVLASLGWGLAAAQAPGALALQALGGLAQLGAAALFCALVVPRRGGERKA